MFRKINITRKERCKKRDLKYIKFLIYVFIYVSIVLVLIVLRMIQNAITNEVFQKSIHTLLSKL